MKIKTILNLLILLSMTLVIVNAADYYDPVQFTFSNQIPENIKLYTYKCLDATCTNTEEVTAEYYKNDAVGCYLDNVASGNVDAFNECIQQYKLNSDIWTLDDCDTINDGCSGSPTIFVKYDSTAPFGYVTWFLPKGDTYIPKYSWRKSMTCNYDVCVDTTVTPSNFEKVATAVAEVGQVNIKNINNDHLPVQVEIPVSIDETVCSAYKLAMPNLHRPSNAEIPAGYSDFSASTDVSLSITRLLNNQNLYSQEMNIAIDADTCAGLAAFSWTPPADLENEDIKFRVDTDVVDNQVVTSYNDFAEVDETIYPSNLDDSCWTRSYDFTLSNTQTFDSTPSLVQIVKGETLYALFRAGAWTGNAIVPINFDAKLYFDNVLVLSDSFASEDNEANFYVDLSSQIMGLSEGYHTVKLVTTPSTSYSCTNSNSVEQVQNLQILAPDSNTISFIVSDTDSNRINDSNINLKIISADDSYQTTPVYNEDRTTDTNGIASFSDVINGDYKYEVSKNGFANVVNNIHIGGNQNVYVTMSADNTPPVIDLPQDYTLYYGDTLEINIADFVSDFNDDFSDLSFSDSYTGDANIDFTNGKYTISSTNNADSIVTLTVTVTDSYGASATDSTTIHFISNQKPVINSFYAENTNGDGPFTTNFITNVVDPDNDDLTCTINFDDGTILTDDCANLQTVSHTFEQTRQYNVQLSVTDNINDAVVASETIFVFDMITSVPHIDFFNIQSSNGDFIKTDLTLSWAATSPDNKELTCELYVNGISELVSCAESNHKLLNYNVLGEGTFTLVVRDDTNQVLRTITKTFTKAGPKIDSFDLTSSNGNYVPTDIGLTWSASSNSGYPITCDLNVNGETQGVACNGNILFNNFDTAGSNTFTITVSDGEDSDSKTINRLFLEEAPDGEPQINSFSLASSNGNYVPTDLTFSWDVTHTTNEDMTCILNVNGVDNDVDCGANDYVIDDFNTVGTSTFTLTATDGTNTDTRTITRTFVQTIGEPQINSFSVASSNGNYVPTNLTFSWDVTHTTNEDMTCILNVNGVDNDVDCGQDYTINSFNTVGTNTFTLTATDGTNTDSRTITRTFEQTIGELQINSFTVTSSNGNYVPTNLTFSWTTSNPSGLNLICSLNVNGDVSFVNCEEPYELNNFNINGTSSFTLYITDGDVTKSRTITRTFLRSQPTINYFTMTTSNGFLLPSNITFNWDVSYNGGENMVCVLSYGGNNYNVDCNANTYEILNYATQGDVTFNLTASDSYSSVAQSIDAFFTYGGVVDYEIDDLNLMIDSVLVPGDFSFSLQTQNETLAKRDLHFKPTIICNGISNNLKTPNKELPTKAVSTRSDNSFIFNLQSNTLDYKFSVPTDTQCTFNLGITDLYGTNITLSKNVMFQYPEAKKLMTSIRGSGEDIMDYMSTAAGSSIQKGYNNIQFNVANNENIPKEISISMISSALGINYNTKINLAPGQETRVSIPMYINGDIKNGMYAARYSIRSNNDKQVRYSYINIQH